MFNLVVRSIKNYREEFPIKGQVVVIGRGDNVHIQIQSNKISRKQFRIISKGLKIYIEDLNSANGTFLNDEQLTKITQITENDVIQFGDMYAQLNNTNKIKKDFKVDQIVDELIQDRKKKTEKPYYKLESMDKRYPGLVFELNEGVSTLGRTGASTIVIPDQTLSKKHMKIDRQGNKLFLSDLGSINGVRVNGRKLREPKQVFDNDKIEIGDVKFKILSNIELEKTAGGSKKKVLLIASVAIVLLLLLVVALKPKKKKVVFKKKVVTIEKQAENDERRLNRILSKAERFASKAKWDDAIKNCDDVLMEDPANQTAKKYKAKYIKNKEYKIYYNQGKEAFDLLNHEDAIKEFSKVPKHTFYYDKAKLYTRESKDYLKRKYFSDAKVFYKANRFRDSYASLKKLFDITSYHSEALELKTEVEKSMRRYRIKYEKFDIKLDDVKLSTNVNAKEEIKKIYKYKEFYTPIEYYVKGDIEYAIKYLNKISVTNPYYRETRVLLKQVLFIRTKYALGNSFIVKKDYPRARTEWDKVLETDLALLKGAKVESKYAQMIKTHLSDGFYEIGKKAFKAKLFKSAYIKLKESLKYNPQNTYALSEMSKLKRRAEEFWTKSLTAEKKGDRIAFRYWDAIVNMTDKKDPLHKKAFDKLNNAAQ